MNRISKILVFITLSVLPFSLLAQHQVIENIVGNGTDVYSGGNALESGILTPAALDMDTEGNYYFSGGFSEYIYKYTRADSTISRIPSESIVTGIAIDDNNYLYYCLNSALSEGYTLNRINLEDNSVTIIAGTGEFGATEDGVLATETAIVNAVDVILDPQQENLYYISFSDNTIRRINLENGYTYLVAGIPGFAVEDDIPDGTSATDANLQVSSGLAVDDDGRVYFTHSQSMIKMVDLDGKIYHFMGTIEPGFSGDGGPASEAQFEGAQTKIIFDQEKNMIISDNVNNRIRKIDAETNIITTIAGTGRIPSDDEEDLGNLENGEFLELLEANIQPIGLVYNEFNELIFCDTKLRVRRVFTCKNPDKPVTKSSYEICTGDEITLSVDADLNHATEWSWYKDGCLIGEKLSSTSELTIVGGDATKYYVVGTGGCTNSTECAEFIIENDCLDYYNTFTPNGDGVNDFFDIPIIMNYPENEVIFYNRWGDQLETIKNYDNSTVYWEGTNGGGDKLDAGTYFFTATSGGESIASGWVQIILD